MDQDPQYYDDHFPNEDDEETDELGLRIAAHAKSRQQELDNAPPSPPMTRRNRAADWKLDDATTKPREPFWRAKERYALDENGDENGTEKTRPRQHLRAVSDGPPLPSPTDLPVNIPQTWGARNRHRAHWLNRSTTEGEGLGFLESVKKVDEDTVLLHRPRFTGDDILAEGGTTPPFGRRRTLQFSSPNSLGNMNTTLQNEVDDLEFNDDSVLVSTPAAPTNRNRNRKIDEIMKEEEEAEAVNITTQRQSRFSTRTTTETTERPVSAPDGFENRPFPRRRRQSSKEKQQDQSAKDQNGAEMDRHRPVVTFKDSDNSTRDLLRKLARVSSLSPSPAPDKTVRDFPDQRPTSDDAKSTGDVNGDTSHVPTVRQRPGRKTPSINNFFGNGPTQERDTSQKPSRTSERDTRRINSEPLQPKSALEAILNEGRDNIGDSTIASLEDIVNPDVEDSSVAEQTTTKQAVVEEGEDRRRREEREFEDANRRLRVARTSIKDADRGLRRLENRLGETREEEHIPPPEKEAESKRDPPLENTIKWEPTPPQPTTKQSTAETAEIRKRPQQQTSKSTNPQQRPKPNTQEAPLGSYHPPALPSHLKPYTNHNNRTLCRHCGGRYTSVWMGLWTEFRELFYTYEGDDDAAIVGGQVKIKLTWLGWIFAVWIGWILSEIVIARIFPERWVVGARFPFVGISMVVRSGRWVLETAGNLLLGGASAGKTNVSSLGDVRTRTRRVEGDSGGDWVTATAAATQRVVRSAVEAVDEVGGSMWDDEYLDL